MLNIYHIQEKVMQCAKNIQIRDDSDAITIIPGSYGKKAVRMKILIQSRDVYDRKNDFYAFSNSASDIHIPVVIKVS